MKRVCLNIGDIVVTREPAILETVLGSCVAVCLWDTRNRIGGLNHYLVPVGRGEPEKARLYGNYSIPSLIEQFLRLGAEPRHIQARIFGGGSILKSLEDIFTIGSENVRIARELLQQYGIPVARDFVGAECGIRISFATATGAVAVTCFDQESAHRYEDYLRPNEEDEPTVRSIHRGGFFANAELFETLRAVALPALIEQRRHSRRLRFWSIGCATGEAAYSTAISTNELLLGHAATSSQPFGGWDIRVLATDLSLKALNTATAGTYGIEQLPASLPADLTTRNFLKGSGAMQGHIRVKQHLLDSVKFRRLNLKAMPYPLRRQFDLVVYHDGLLPFSDLTRQQAFLQLHRHLAPDGFLLIGQTGITPDQRLFEQLETCLYRKFSNQPTKDRHHVS